MSTSIHSPRPLFFALSAQHPGLLHQIARAIEGVRYGQVQVALKNDERRD